MKLIIETNGHEIDLDVSSAQSAVDVLKALRRLGFAPDRWRTTD